MTRAACVVLALGILACGGKQTKTTPDESGDSDLPPAEQTAEEGGGGDISPVDPTVVSNENMEEVNRLLDRRRPAVSRCLAFAVDNKELPKNSRGKMTLQIVIAPSGKPQDVKVLQSSLESKSLQDCVVNKVKEIVFPELPKQYQTTYTYGFEAL